MSKHAHLIIVTDCGGSDRGRYEIAAARCFFPHDLRITFFATESMNTLHCGFTAAAHALSTVGLFGPLAEGELTGLLVNAAPRHGKENGRALRGKGRKSEGEEIYALRLQSGVWVVGPNAGANFYFLRDQIAASFLVTDTSNQYTPFRSMEVMVPALAHVLGVRQNPDLRIEPKELVIPPIEAGVFVADWDSHGNIYLVSTQPDMDWMPALGENRVYSLGTKTARLRHVDGIFASCTGEQTLTRGSLKLNGPVYYIVLVGGNAHFALGSPPVGTRVEIEEE